jgi:hypothetical protein
MFPLLLSVKAIALFKLQFCYEDDTKGVIDLSYLAGRV